jgi:hypothetical protein
VPKDIHKTRPKAWKTLECGFGSVMSQSHCLNTDRPLYLQEDQFETSLERVLRVTHKAK